MTPSTRLPRRGAVPRSTESAFDPCQPERRYPTRDVCRAAWRPHIGCRRSLPSGRVRRNGEAGAAAGHRSGAQRRARVAASATVLVTSTTCCRLTDPPRRPWYSLSWVFAAWSPLSRTRSERSAVPAIRAQVPLGPRRKPASVSTDLRRNLLRLGSPGTGTTSVSPSVAVMRSTSPFPRSARSPSETLPPRPREHGFLSPGQMLIDLVILGIGARIIVGAVQRAQRGSLLSKHLQ